MSLRDAATLIGVSHSTLQRIETGRAEMTVKTARALSKFLKCDMADLLQRKESS